ncbi:MAG: hypothetical protein KDD78_19555 [Caldilineaceae bacterium]|nr:hypothetical protein [Caldilineaceae bacterium]
MQHSIYRPPFTPDHYYVVPLDWLAEEFKAARVDTCDVLLYHTHQDTVIFDVDTPESWPQHDDQTARTRKLFSRQTYSTYKNQLMYAGLLEDVDPRTLPAGPSIRLTLQLREGIKYRWTDWPPTEPWLFRPHGYMRRRWPAWLGSPDPSSRLALVALLALSHLQISTRDRSPEVIAWTDILDFAAARFGHCADLQPLGAKLRKGLDELRILGLVDRPTPDATWHFVPARLDAPPAWPVEPLADAVRLDPVRDRPLLTAVRELIVTCAEPVTQVPKIRNAFQQEYRPWVFDEFDVEMLQDHIRAQRHGRMLRHNQVMHDFIRKTEQQRLPLLGATFSLRVTAVDIADRDVTGALLTMPVTSTSFLTATQIRMTCRYPDDLTSDELADIFAHTTLYAWQETPGIPVELIHLPLPAPTEDRIKHGFTLNATGLHTKLDYGQPFQILLRSLHPEPRLQLDGTIRVMRHQSTNYRTPGRHDPRGPDEPRA